ncbi:hypothetical protein B0H63DRAFT_565939 [Podospora didyma]|uniref:Uncharacterized protein n=1 Tax=Podospora didyma TaxID=330526 RepID=A0AAE0N0T4_9PEZI|nr:hypothetical protein B0H63DRAFT_565939 [Podospora didyma]
MAPPRSPPGLVFTLAPPTADARGLPQADYTHLKLPADGAPWEPADLFMEASQAMFKTYTLAWTPRRPYQEEDIYECTLHHDDEIPAARGKPPLLSATTPIAFAGALLPIVLLLRLLFLDYWPLAQSFITDNKLEIRLITFTRSSVRAINVGLSFSTTAETTISFTLQDLPPLHIEDAETTTSWQPFLSWALGSHGESQRHRGGRFPAWENGTQFAIRERIGRRTPDGEYEHKPRDWAGAGRSCSVSDSVDWAEDNTGSRRFNPYKSPHTLHRATSADTLSGLAAGPNKAPTAPEPSPVWIAYKVKQEIRKHAGPQLKR